MTLIFHSNTTSYSNRGLSLENRINLTLDEYKKENIALIYKKPTPIKIINYDEKTNYITKAVFLKKSTTDYNGVFKRKYLDFEAKSTKSKTSFPLHNIEEHQISHLSLVDLHGGIAFFIVEFSLLNEIYLLPFSEFKNFINQNNSSSIPLSYFKTNGYLIKQTLKYPVHFIENFEKIVNF